MKFGWIPGLVLAGALQLQSAMVNIDGVLEKVRKDHQLPALAAAFIKDGEITAVGVVGFRKEGDPTPVAVDDKFHIGSITKSMTATLAGMQVEEGKLSWDSTLGSIFKDFTNQMHVDYQPVTLELLLSHHGGAPDHGNVSRPAALKHVWNSKGSLRDQRLYFTKHVTRQPPEASPGTKFIYSNPGYVFAGAMMERVANEQWEDLMARKLFNALKFERAGFGPPGTKKMVDQPWGHVEKKGKIEPVDHSDNNALIGPAGTVHCSISDLAKYTLFQLKGARGEGSLLKKETFSKLHTAGPGKNYALGWGVAERGWAKGKVLTHTGSNTMWFTVIWIAPNRNAAVAVCTNIGSERGEKGTDAVASALIQQFLK